ncbi:MAG: hypothetical protein H6608_05830 [Flavobacteriales bacterium]|nr:hypothetical protein [Flavobacteriales bacterium]
MMRLLPLLLCLISMMSFNACSSEQSQVDDMVKTDQERADSAKKALGIE